MTCCCSDCATTSILALYLLGLHGRGGRVEAAQYLTLGTKNGLLHALNGLQ